MSYFIDVQGTLISDEDKSLISGARELIEHLNKKNIPYLIITNNTKEKSEDFLNSLRQKGLEIKEGAYLDPFCVLANLLMPCDVACFGDIKFINTMRSLGYTQTSNSPKALVVASGCEFEFSEFATMIESVLNGARAIAMHATSIYKKNGRKFPGVGAIASMIQNATGCEFDVVGKPSEEFYIQALRLLNLQKSGHVFKDITIISDDARGDLAGAKALGMKTALVLSGKVSEGAKSGVAPSVIDKIYGNVGDFLKDIDGND